MTQSQSDRPLLDLIGKMTADSLEATTLDAPTTMLVRIAALVAVGAPPASYLLNLSAASEVGLDADQVRSVLLAIAPIVGTPRVTGAAGNIARALGFALELADAEADTA
jgi:alkylhydroperoxidase/carboxymuconolactone decarboxylase family protein YurZ